MSRKLPIGIQGFEKLRTDNFLYVDKTEYIYQLVHNNVPYFLARPALARKEARVLDSKKPADAGGVSAVREDACVQNRGPLQADRDWN